MYKNTTVVIPCFSLVLIFLLGSLEVIKSCDRYCSGITILSARPQETREKLKVRMFNQCNVIFFWVGPETMVTGMMSSKLKISVCSVIANVFKVKF